MTHTQSDDRPGVARGGFGGFAEAARQFLGARVRPLVVSLTAGLAVVVSGTVRTPDWSAFSRATVAPDDRAQMAAAERIIDSLRASAYAIEHRASTRTPLTGAGLIALTYHERLRLGAGSPFRLADYALRDPRLSAQMRRATAWSLLAKTARRESHQVDPASLAGYAERGGVESRYTVVQAARHYALIDSTVAAAATARGGEETVRLALRLAQAERLVDARAVTAGVHVAAMVRDRRLAVRDAHRLLNAASRSDDDALMVLEQWRAARRLAVEQPLLIDGGHAAHGDVVRDASRLLVEFRRASVAWAADSGRGVRLSRAFAQRSFLPPSVARRLADAGAVRGAPPQAPIVVTATGARRRFVSVDRRTATDDTARQRAAAVRRRFVERARTEESLATEQAVARGALLGGGDLALGESPATFAALADVADVTLAAGIALRTYAQEVAWFPEFGAPTEAELRARFGLRRVVFDATIPSAWRPYYHHLLASALAEFRGVLPSVSFDGLTVRVGESVKRDSALALHDPATRTVYLPTGTGAGTIAHEMAHDLDWQAARTWFSLRGAYSTDRAAREVVGREPPAGGQVVPSLSRSVRGLTAARPRSAGAERGGRTPERPAELFARGVDWLTAAALAREGRMNGYLTSVQDATLPGYAGGIAPEPGDRAADALVEVLDDMTVLPSVTRAWYLGRFGESARPSPDAVARLALTSGPSYASERVLRTLGFADALIVPDRPRPLSRAALAGPPACRLAVREPWRADLLWVAAESRARGVLRERALRWSSPAVARWSWEAQATLGGPWDPSIGREGVRRVRDAVLRQMVREDDARGPAERLGLSALVFGGCE